MNSPNHQYVAAVFDDPDHAQAVVEDMIKHDFPMDRVSLLHRAGGHGDDFLGIAYGDEKERFKVWGTHGALWGALAGLISGAAGLVLLPGIGPVLVAGPLIDALVGAATGAGLMTAGAAVTHLTLALRHLGIPEQELNTLHEAIMAGKTVLLMHCEDQSPDFWRQKLAWQGADPVLTIP